MSTSRLTQYSRPALAGSHGAHDRLQRAIIYHTAMAFLEYIRIAASKVVRGADINHT